jgi:hypothetical protein
VLKNFFCGESVAFLFVFLPLFAVLNGVSSAVVSCFNGTFMLLKGTINVVNRDV